MSFGTRKKIFLSAVMSSYFICSAKFNAKASLKPLYVLVDTHDYD